MSKQYPSCLDCKWVRDAERCDGEYAKCGAPETFETETRFNPISGKTEIRKAKRFCGYCEFFRKPGRIISFLDNMCGRHGRWFEPKEKNVES